MLQKTPGLQDTLIAQVAGDLSYHASTWQAVVGELLVACAVNVPRIPLEPGLLCAVLGHEGPQSEKPFIYQVLHGARELNFGAGVYRPDHAGFNDADDVARLAAYLQTVDPDHWIRPPGIDPEEVRDAQAWWPELVGMYQAAQRQGWLIVCETP